MVAEVHGLIISPSGSTGKKYVCIIATGPHILPSECHTYYSYHSFELTVLCLLPG